MKLNRTKIAYHYTFIDKLLPGSFQTETTAKISRVGHAHPDFLQGGRLPTLLPSCRRPCCSSRRRSCKY